MRLYVFLVLAGLAPGNVLVRLLNGTSTDPVWDWIVVALSYIGLFYLMYQAERLEEVRREVLGRRLR